MKNYANVRYDVFTGGFWLLGSISWVVAAGWWRVHRTGRQEPRFHASDTDQLTPWLGRFSYLGLTLHTGE